MDLGLSAAKKLGASMPIAAATRELVQQAIDAGHTDCDFGILLEIQAEASGMQLNPENVEVDDGLN
jgi:3-hydroxyisobutyrate dehydrogenase-like beta-hydroxyacid dehydrogenase